MCYNNCACVYSIHASHPAKLSVLLPHGEKLQQHYFIVSQYITVLLLALQLSFYLFINYHDKRGFPFHAHNIARIPTPAQAESPNSEVGG